MTLSSQPPQFGQCCMSMSNARWSSRAHFINRLAPNLPFASTGSWPIGDARAYQMSNSKDPLPAAGRAQHNSTSPSAGLKAVASA